MFLKIRSVGVLLFFIQVLMSTQGLTKEVSDIYSYSDPGSRIKKNEDSYGVKSKNNEVFGLVSDGHGEKGYVISQSARLHFLESFPLRAPNLSPQERLKDAIAFTHRKIIQEELFEFKNTGIVKNRGATFVAFHAPLEDEPTGQVHLALIGDAMGLVVSKNDNEYTHLETQAQTMMNEKERIRHESQGCDRHFIDKNSIGYSDLKLKIALQRFRPTLEKFLSDMPNTYHRNPFPSDIARYAYEGRCQVGTMPTRVLGRLISHDPIYFEKFLENMGNGRFCKALTAEPEFYQFPKGNEGTVILLASDGLTDFLFSQEVVDLIKSNWDKSAKETGEIIREALLHRIAQSPDLKDDTTFVLVKIWNTTPN